MTTFRRFAVVAALLTTSTLAPGLAAADDHRDRDDRGRYDEREGRNDRYMPPVAPRWVERDELRWSGPGQYDGRWDRQSHLLRARALRLELVELDRERADYYARNSRRPWLLARYDAFWSVRRAELERQLEWLRVTARR
jgi:hypothetical protein